MSAQADPVAGVMAILANDPDVAAIVGDRVFGGELGKDESKLMPRSSVIVRFGGGTNSIGTAYQSFGDLRIDVIAFGKTPKRAGDLYLAIAGKLEAVKSEDGAGCRVFWARRAGGPTPARDADTDWPYVFSSWQTLIHKTPLS